MNFYLFGCDFGDCGFGGFGGSGGSGDGNTNTDGAKFLTAFLI